MPGLTGRPTSISFWPTACRFGIQVACRNSDIANKGCGLRDFLDLPCQKLYIRSALNAPTSADAQCRRPGRDGVHLERLRLCLSSLYTQIVERNLLEGSTCNQTRSRPARSQDVNRRSQHPHIPIPIFFQLALRWHCWPPFHVTHATFCRRRFLTTSEASASVSRLSSSLADGRLGVP